MYGMARPVVRSEYEGHELHTTILNAAEQDISSQRAYLHVTMPFIVAQGQSPKYFVENAITHACWALLQSFPFLKQQLVVQLDTSCGPNGQPSRYRLALMDICEDPSMDMDIFLHSHELDEGADKRLPLPCAWSIIRRNDTIKPLPACLAIGKIGRAHV